MLAYPTPTFDAKTIRSGPDHRPLGRGAQQVLEQQPEAATPLNLINKNTKNGWVGTRAKHFIQNNQFDTNAHHYDPTKGTPLSKPGSVGNVDTQAISAGRPTRAEPANGELQAILAVLNGKTGVEEHVGKLSAKQIASLGRKSAKLTGPREGVPASIKDFSDARAAMREAEQIKGAMAQGFSEAEARAAYRRVRDREAEIALTKEQDPSDRLYDLIDSKIAGTQNGNYRSNDETGLFLAKGGNVVLEKKAVLRNEELDRAALAASDPQPLVLKKQVKRIKKFGEGTRKVHPFFNQVPLKG